MVCAHCPTPRPIKMAYIELCRGVHTAQRQILSTIGFFANLSVSAAVSVFVSTSVSGNVNTPLISPNLTVISFELYKTKANKFHLSCHRPLG